MHWRRGQKVKGHTVIRKPSRRTVASDYSRRPVTLCCATCGRCRRGSACRYDCLCFLVTYYDKATGDVHLLCSSRTSWRHQWRISVPLYHNALLCRQLTVSSSAADSCLTLLDDDCFFLGRGVKYCDQCVCLSVCLLAWAYLKNHTSKFRQMFYSLHVGLRSAVVRSSFGGSRGQCDYILHFRMCGWRHV